MKCSKCGKEWSDSVYPFHVKDCGKNPAEIKADEPKKTPVTSKPEPPEETPEKELTKGLIIVALNRLGVEYDPKAEKEDLLILLNKSKKEA